MDFEKVDESEFANMAVYPLINPIFFPVNDSIDTTGYGES